MSRNLLRADQVALRLGVKLPTVYAYVSRGILDRLLAADGRTSLFDPAQVEALARRGRPRSGATRRGTVDVSLSTSITRIESDRLSYRGRDVGELAAVPFERVAELLWTGELPEHAAWPAPRRRLRATGEPLVRFAIAAASLSVDHPLRGDLGLGSVLLHARALVGAFVEVLPGEAHDGRVAERLWPKLSPLPARPDRVAALDAALVVLADHELATSTMAVRIAASCRADPFAAVLAGLGALNGPLHGGAARTVHGMLEDAAQTSADAALARVLDRLRGFGHPVYPGEDPRATILLAHVDAIAARRERDVVAEVRRVATRVAGQPPNVDFALAALAFTGRMHVGATEAIFALARTAGFLAHALEEYGEEPLRFRARAIFVGNSPKQNAEVRRTLA